MLCALDEKKSYTYICITLEAFNKHNNQLHVTTKRATNRFANIVVYLIIDRSIERCALFESFFITRYVDLNIKI